MLQTSWESEHHEDDEAPEESWFAQLRPCRWILLALQVWPLCERGGRVVFRKRTPHSLYAILAWTATAAIAYRGLMHWIQVIGVSGYFSLKAYFAFFVIVGHTPLVIPLLHWTTLPRVTRAFNFSHRFQVNFLRLFRVPLRLGLARRAAVMGFIAPLLGVSITFWAHFYGYLPWQQFPTYEMSATYLTIVPGTWQLTVWGLETSAQQLMHQLTQVLRREGDQRDGRTCAVSTPRGRGHDEGSAKTRDPMEAGFDSFLGPTDTTERLRQVRWLWLQLDHSARLWARAWTYALGHLLLFSMATFLLSLFGVMVPLLRAQTLDERQAGMVAGIGHNFHNIYSVCAAGHRVRTQVRDTFVKELLRIKLPDTESIVYREVFKFLDAINMQDTKVSLRGYVTVDRKLTFTCAAVLLTYVVVLLQFAYAKGAQ